MTKVYLYWKRGIWTKDWEEGNSYSIVSHKLGCNIFVKVKSMCFVVLHVFYISNRYIISYLISNKRLTRIKKCLKNYTKRIPDSMPQKFDNWP